MKKLLLVSLIIIMVIGLIFGGCAAIAPSLAPIKIGLLYPLTGPVSMIGKFLVSGGEFLFEEAGYEVAGRKIEVIVEDSGGTPDMAIDKARKLVENDKVCMIIGPLVHGAKLAVASYMSQKGVPHLIAHSGTLELTKYEWSFMVGGSDPQITSPMALYAYDEMGLRTVTVMTEDTVTGHSFLGNFMDVFKRRGGKVIQEQYPTFPCTDYASFFSNLKDADAVVAWFQGTDSIRFLTQFHEFGIRKRMPLVAAYNGSFVQPFLLQILKPEVSDAMIGEYQPADWTYLIETDVSKRFVEAFKKAKGRMPWDFETKAYSGSEVALRALEATVGDTTPEKLRKAIMAVEFEAVEGPFRLDQETRIAVRDVYIVKIDKIGDNCVLVPVKTCGEIPPRGL